MSKDTFKKSLRGFYLRSSASSAVNSTVNSAVKFLRLILWLLAVSAVVAAEPLTVPLGGNKSVMVDFDATEYGLFGNSDAVKVSLIQEAGGTRVRIDGVKLGNCDVSVINADGGDGMVYSVEVTENDVEAVYKQFRTRLDREGVPALDVGKSKNKVSVSGTLGNRTDWDKLENILRLDEFRGKVESTVRFSVDPKIIASLRAQFVRAGFDVAPEGEFCDDGQISIVYEHNLLTVAGTVFSESERAKIATLLDGHKSWLKVVDSPPADAWRSPTALGTIAVGLDNAEVELTVAVVAYSEAKVKNYGNERDKGGFSLTSPINLFFNLINGQFDRSVGVGASLDSLVTFEEGDTFSRDVERLSMRFNCNSPDGEELKFGGTLMVKMTTKDKDGNPVEDMKEIPYGFIVVKKEARRTTADRVVMKLDITQRKLPVFRPDGSYDLKEVVYKEPVSCKLGHTTKVGDYQKLIEETKVPTGIPYLRNVPILSWFVSKEGYLNDDKKVMLLASVRLVGADEEPALALTEMEDISPMIEISTQDIAEKKKDKTVYWLLPWTWF